MVHVHQTIQHYFGAIILIPLWELKKFPHCKCCHLVCESTLVLTLFQLQLSEVIMRTRRYMTEVLGREGNVLMHHVHVEELEKKFLQAGLEEETVKKFLKQLTYDNEGWVKLLLFYVWNVKLSAVVTVTLWLVCAELFTYFLGVESWMRTINWAIRSVCQTSKPAAWCA